MIKTFTGNRKILITGTTSGIGRATALRLAAAGHMVFATGRSEDKLNELKLEADNDHLLIRRLDVCDHASIADTLEFVEEKTGGYGLDVLVNNAGYSQSGPLEALVPDLWRRQFETNVFGLMECTRAFIGHMRERGNGCIINISSVVGRISVPFQGAYCASKHAVEALSDALRIEAGLFGIDVVSIQPGSIRTGFADIAYDGKIVEAAGPYAPHVERYFSMARKLDNLAPGPEIVAKVIEKAINKRKPRARYVVPFRNRFIFFLRALLPQRVFDFFFRRVIGG